MFNCHIEELLDAPPSDLRPFRIHVARPYTILPCIGHLGGANKDQVRLKVKGVLFLMLGAARLILSD